MTFLYLPSQPIPIGPVCRNSERPALPLCLPAVRSPKSIGYGLRIARLAHYLEHVERLVAPMLVFVTPASECPIRIIAACEHGTVDHVPAVAELYFDPEHINASLFVTNTLGGPPQTSHESEGWQVTHPRPPSVAQRLIRPIRTRYARTADSPFPFASPSM
mgnify:CR=1 FL=1